MRCRHPALASVGICVVGLALGAFFAPRAALASATGSHTGAMVRLGLGIGVGGLSVSNTDTTENGDQTFTREPVDAGVTGGGGVADISVGYFVVPNLALRLELLGLWLPGPGGSYNNKDNNAQLFSGSAHIAFTYYITPVDVHVGAGVGVNLLGLGQDWSALDPGAGVSASVSVGKQWCVTDDLGLGIGALVVYAGRRLKDEQTVTRDQTTASGTRSAEEPLGDADASMPLWWAGLTFNVTWD